MAWRVARLPTAGKLLARAALHVAQAEGFTHGELSVAVVGTRRMSRLHEQYMGQRGATDVLTFDLGTDRKRGVLDGEIVVCAEVARRVVRARGVPGRPAAARNVQTELALYVVHGVLHLAGYDDHSPRGFIAMHAREDTLLSELGIGPQFSPGDVRQADRCRSRATAGGQGRRVRRKRGA